VLVTRSGARIESGVLAQDCARADIVISDRFLPSACRPRWLKADRRLLARTGGLAIDLGAPSVRTVRQAGDEHPWMARPAIRPRRSPHQL
jgi:competence protein ComEC